MSVRIRTNEELAHDLLDLIDRWQDGRDAIRDPDSIEREFAVLAAGARTQVLDQQDHAPRPCFAQISAAHASWPPGVERSQPYAAAVDGITWYAPYAPDDGFTAL
jgi:hypothetical protein